MAVFIQTTGGNILVELFVDEAPLMTMNFLKLLKIKRYHNTLVHKLERDFIAEWGIVTSTEQDVVDHSQDKNVFKLLYEYSDTHNKRVDSRAATYKDGIPDEICERQHNQIGLLATANTRVNRNHAAFYVTLRKSIPYLNGRHTVFGQVVEGLEVVEELNRVFADDETRIPLKPVRILRVAVLDDPFPDPVGLQWLMPEIAPVPMEERVHQHIETLQDELDVLEGIAEKEAKSRSVTLEILGDLPDADLAPPENVLFVCKLNPDTSAEDLEIIFSRFGAIRSCDIIRDWKTGDSLQYAFVEFEEKESCQEAYFSMQNVLVDDRRIHVDFCQSVSKQWARFKLGSRPKEHKEEKNWERRRKRPKMEPSSQAFILD
ncbi:MAG: uncharacterized protein KVP18_004377 [Porospora cf. gigantea A]|uniref:uncharacterized protein n=2 Tax=Porospora cf. gigantea A TaxID=2853593 RepID=UPI00355A96E0|nr:MAG: hypothetical protein KVP18_004377 [Porospora cf. gigantea A]